MLHLLNNTIQNKIDFINNPFLIKHNFSLTLEKKTYNEKATPLSKEFEMV